MKGGFLQFIVRICAFTGNTWKIYMLRKQACKGCSYDEYTKHVLRVDEYTKHVLRVECTKHVNIYGGDSFNEYQKHVC